MKSKNILESVTIDSKNIQRSTLPNQKIQLSQCRFERWGGKCNGSGGGRR